MPWLPYLIVRRRGSDVHMDHTPFFDTKQKHINVGDPALICVCFGGLYELNSSLNNANSSINDLKSKIKFESKVLTAPNGWIAIAPPSGYTLLSLYNGDRNAFGDSFDVQLQNGNVVVIFGHSVPTAFRLNCFWIKT